MPITAGDFTASQLLAVTKRADAMFKDNLISVDYEANIDIAKHLIAESNAKVSPLESSEKDYDVKVVWMNICDDTINDCTDDHCEIGGAEAGSDSKDYAITICKTRGFSVDENKFRNNELGFVEAVAKQFLKADKLLAEEIAKTAVAKVDAWAGINEAPFPLGTVNGIHTEIPADKWTEALFPHLYRVGLQNKLSNPFLLSGTNLFEDKILALLDAANADGKGKAKAYKMIRTHFDLFNIDTVVTPAQRTYMIDKGAITFASKNYYGGVPTKYKDQDRYSIASRNIDGLRYDVHYTNDCSGTTIMHKWTVYARFDWLLNPFGCNQNRTGILAFDKVAAQ